jgi:hypothetical protein
MLPFHSVNFQTKTIILTKDVQLRNLIRTYLNLGQEEKHHGKLGEIRVQKTQRVNYQTVKNCIKEASINLQNYRKENKVSPSSIKELSS